MGCTDSEPDEFVDIEKGFRSLIKSVQKEMNEYENEIKNLKIENDYSKKVDDINFKYDQEILKIFHNEYNYHYNYKRGYFLSENLLNNAKECMNNQKILKELNPGVIIKLKAIEKQREDELKKIKNSVKYEDEEKYNDLCQKIELCKNQIKTYEKEKQAAIIARREEIRNRLLKSSMKSGLYSEYKDRQGFNQAIDENYVNRIHNDYNN